MTPVEQPCTWCGTAVEREDGYRVAETPGERRAVFCRLEHVVPWSIQGPHWEAGDIEEPRGLTESLESCSQCGEPLSDVRVAHLADWAKSGGRWR
jgi:hypothetical protein